MILLHSQPPERPPAACHGHQLTPRSPQDHASTPPQAPRDPATACGGHRSDRAAVGGLPRHRAAGLAQDGPRDTRGGLASGFTDTPSGALLAAVNIAVRTAAQWGPPIYAPTITRQVTGPDQAALLHSQASDYAPLRAAAHVRPGQPAGRGYAVEAAYRFAAYAPAGATVDVVTAGPGSDGTTVLAATRIEVIWRRGDWRVVAPPGGDWANSATAISSLTGYRIFPDEG